MTFPRMRTLTAFVLLCLPAWLLALSDDGRKPTVLPNQHAAAQASLAIHLKIAPVVLPPRHKDHDGKDQARDEAAVTYSLSPSATEKLSISQEMRTMLLDSGKHEQVQLTTLVIQ
jgi:hypothetical protein